jgi:putative protease
MNEIIKLKISPKDINFFNRIMEGYEYLGIVTTLDKNAGILIISTTKDFYEDVLGIVENMPMPVIRMKAS